MLNIKHWYITAFTHSMDSVDERSWACSQSPMATNKTSRHGAKFYKWTPSIQAHSTTVKPHRVKSNDFLNGLSVNIQSKGSLFKQYLQLASAYRLKGTGQVVKGGLIYNARYLTVGARYTKVHRVDARGVCTGHILEKLPGVLNLTVCFWGVWGEERESV